MVSKETMDGMRWELSVKAKNGIDFILAASIIWLVISYIWTLEIDAYNKSILTFIAIGLMLPLALSFSIFFKTKWKDKFNPLQPLGLWLNIAQLLYFPFLIFTLIEIPDYFVMVYAIIYGAHLFPYAWFYKVAYYAVLSGITATGALLLGLLQPDRMYLIPVLMSISLIILFVLLYFNSKNRESKTNNQRSSEP